MDFAFFFSILQELMYLLIVFGSFLVYSIVRGRQAVMNVIMGLYVALLISLIFPYYGTFIPDTASAHSVAVGKLILFMIFTGLATRFVVRIMPEEYREGKFESFGKKILLCTSATILVMAFSFHVLPVTEFLSPGTPVQVLFAEEGYFFWWVIVTMVLVYLN